MLSESWMGNNTVASKEGCGKFGDDTSVHFCTANKTKFSL